LTKIHQSCVDPEKFGVGVNKTSSSTQSDGVLTPTDAPLSPKLEEIRALVRLVSTIEYPVNDVVSALRVQLGRGVPLEVAVENMLERWCAGQALLEHNDEVLAQQTSP
jgi:hypothetical protein